MDAKRLACLLCAAIAVCTVGCEWGRPAPATHQEREIQPEPEPRAEVVADAQAGAGEQNPLSDIEQWAEQIQQVQRRDDLRVRAGGRAESGAYLADNPADVFRAEHFAPQAGGQPWAGEATTYGQPNPAATGLPKEAPSPTVNANIPREGAGTPTAREPEPGAPPKLTGVRVWADARPAQANAVREVTLPMPNTAEHAAANDGSLGEVMDAWLAQPSDGSFRAQLDRRLVAVLSGDFAAAREPLDSVSAEQRQMAERLVETLITLRDAHGGAPGRDAERLLSEVHGLEDVLVRMGRLRMPTMVLCRSVRGYGQYEEFSPATFPAGRVNEFVVYCELRSFVSRQNDKGEYEASFSMETQILTPGGSEVLRVKDENIVDRCRSRRRDCFIPRLVRLPASLSAGEYVAKVKIVDRIGETVAEQRTTFRLAAR